MKKIGLIVSLCVAVIAGISSAPKAKAEAYSSTRIVSNQFLAANSTNTYSAVIDLTQFQEVSFQFDSVLSGSGSATWLIQGSRSDNGVTYETTPSFNWSIAASGTSSNCAVTNVYVGAVGKLKITSIGNGNANSGTGTFQIGKKTRIHGNELN